MDYLNVQLRIRHRNLTSECVYWANQFTYSKKAYLGNFYLAMSSDTPIEVDLSCLFNPENVEWRVNIDF